ncbi:exopolysaccharide biosynthesis polyprenyl glycosylphosphotransferase [Dyadobacter jejuensis]|uniref:Exopolysaccharide biosynthesis polyprenyl glycosylphosphotransferase n=1 Tax=Dyadobacter jejuensis TaxID=1082580 RepID=A0A316AST6_9BACT|nr:sugar transferase [Dyadobacter jejuensis]PWJ60379.1 exopolysaccharide biosynthesis polyprenyl glycosylphosphotransferase [Dyadobacter jejuensis]
MSYKYLDSDAHHQIADKPAAFKDANSILNFLLSYFSLKSSFTIPSRIGAIFTLLFLDGMVAVATWVFFYVYRFGLLQKDFFWSMAYLGWPDVFLGLVVVPFGWCFLYYLSGTYFDLYKKARIVEIKRTLGACLIGTFIIAWIAFSNDALDFAYFKGILWKYALVHTSLTLLVRMLYLSMIHHNVVSGKVLFNTLIIGGNENAINLFKKIKSSKKSYGNRFVGFVYSSLESSNGMSGYLPKLGNINELEAIIDKYKIEEIIVAVDSDEHSSLKKILLQVSYRQVYIKILPDLYDIISGSVRITDIYDDSLFIHIAPSLMPGWQKVSKRMLDIAGSLFALVVLSPIYLFASIKVLMSSPGPIVYRQERVGLYGKKFNILKFRSMVVNAEALGPSLSSDGDPRITKWGRVMRKYRIDELPQFFNVLKGDMSLVGPRPERQHFIDIISKSQPEYRYLHKVRPGLTSWGMVKYGYAENVTQMVERMKYDILYIENCSLMLDIKIIFHTIATVLGGHGK